MTEVFTFHMPGPPPPAPSLTEGCWDWPDAKINAGYGTFTVITDRGKKKQILAHRAAYQIYCGPLANEMHVLHSCDRPPCCQPAHLRSGNDLENAADCSARGRRPLGEDHCWAKLTEADVLLIRQGSLSLRELAEMLGVSEATVSAARSGKTWKHVTPLP